MVMIAGLALVLAGCGSGNDVTPDATAVSTSASRVAAELTPTPVAIAISDVVWTSGVDPTTRQPQDTVSAYTTTSPAIIAAVQVGALSTGTTLTATWSIDGVPVPAVTMEATVERPIEDGWATFQFTREEGRRFPLGHLQVEITASDGTVVTGEVDIVLP